MNRINQAATTATGIVDVQGIPDTRRIAIDHVGIKSIRHPMRVRDVEGVEQHTIATFSMYVNLPHHQKGTHMSRFVALLDDADFVLSLQSLPGLIDRMTDLLDAEAGYLEIAFPWFMSKPAPITGIRSAIDYEVTLRAVKKDARTDLYLRVVVPVTSLCPCSREISEYGAHNQRSHITLTARLGEAVGIDDMIRMIEGEGSCELYGLLKRPDEKYVTERAYENPKFVEDIVRDVAGHLNRDERILGYTVESENFESIHNHSAYACIEYTREGAPEAL